ncbi:MAG: PAS domain-containing protein, partial [Mariprofundaceae bacterium]
MVHLRVEPVRFDRRRFRTWCAIVMALTALFWALAAWALYRWGVHLAGLGADDATGAAQRGAWLVFAVGVGVSLPVIWFWRRAIEQERVMQEMLRREHELLCMVARHAPALLYGGRLRDGWLACDLIGGERDRFGGVDASTMSDPAWWRAHVHPEDAQAKRFPLDPEKGEVELSHHFRLADGEGGWRWVDERMALVREGVRGRSGWRVIGCWLDITD